MKYLFLIIIFLSPTFAESLTVEIEELPTKDIETPVQSKPTVLMIDDYEDGDLIKFREWWTFDKVLVKTKEIEEKEIFLGKKSILINGSSNNWYAGGIGVYLDEDAHYFETLKLVIYSPK